MNLSIASTVALLSLGIGASVGNLVNDLWHWKGPSLSVAEFSYNPATDTVTQRLAIDGRGPVQATWAVRIDRPGADRALCEGTGTSAYVGSRAVLPLENWASPDCPELQTGDVLRATWRWSGGQVTAETVVR